MGNKIESCVTSNDFNTIIDEIEKQNNSNNNNNNNKISKDDKSNTDNYKRLFEEEFCKSWDGFNYQDEFYEYLLYYQ